MKCALTDHSKSVIKETYIILKVLFAFFLVFAVVPIFFGYTAVHFLEICPAIPASSEFNYYFQVGFLPYVIAFSIAVAFLFMLLSYNVIYFLYNILFNKSYRRRFIKCK